MINKHKIDILGGGPAGLSVGYFAQKKGKSVSIHEGSASIGGNCRTIKMGDYRFDTGAHRFHDKIPIITKEIKQLMGDDLLKINAPSKIYADGRIIDFPLNFQSVIKNLKMSEIVNIIFENFLNIFKNKTHFNNFKHLAYGKYGRTLSNLFLINYTEKLWGIEADKLQTTISGNRLKNLNIKSMIIEMIMKKSKVKHFEGSFYYPKYGYGTIFDNMAKNIGYENINLDAKVSKIFHDGQNIREVEYENGKNFKVQYVINTLPITSIIKMLNPLPAQHLIEKANSLKFRNLKLCTLTLDKPLLTNNASIYFPEKSIFISRIYEPKNRSLKMAPKDKTSLAIEIPYSAGDNIDSMEAIEIIDMIKSILIRKNLIKHSEMIAFNIFDIKNAYPVLQVGQENDISELTNFLQSFNNHQLIGRNIEFDYLHTHKIMWKAKTLVENLVI